MYIYTHLIYKGEPGPGALLVAFFPHGVGPEAFCDVGDLFIDKTALGNSWDDGSQQADSNIAGAVYLSS